MTSIWGPYGDNVTTDQLFPWKYAYLSTIPQDIIPHLLEGLDETFAQKVQAGDVIIGGKNFGCGSPLYHPAPGLKALGVTIIASSFARYFFRIAINHGVSVISCPLAVEAYQSGKSLSVDSERSTIVVDDTPYPFRPYNPYVKGIIAAGGLIPFIQNELRESRLRGAGA